MRGQKKFFGQKNFFLETSDFLLLFDLWLTSLYQQKRNHIFPSNGSEVIQHLLSKIFLCTLYIALPVWNTCNFWTVRQNLSCSSSNERSWEARDDRAYKVDQSSVMWTKVQQKFFFHRSNNCHALPPAVARFRTYSIADSGQNCDRPPRLRSRWVWRSFRPNNRLRCKLFLRVLVRQPKSSGGRCAKSGHSKIIPFEPNVREGTLCNMGQSSEILVTI